jgi:Protein of unknown function (DUF3822)
MFVFYYHHERLLFSNSFQCSSPRDVLYFLMATFQQFNLDPEFTPLWLSGKLHAETDLYRLIRRYVRSVYFIGLPPNLKTGALLSESPAHDLFIPLCGLL